MKNNPCQNIAILVAMVKIKVSPRLGGPGTCHKSNSLTYEIETYSPETSLANSFSKISKEILV